MTKIENKEKKNIVLNVLKWIFYILVILIFTLAIWLAIDRFTFYNAPIFGYRISVISSPSMSYVNESNKEFLEGHDDRLQVNDLIFTEPINDINDLNIYDIITYISDDNILICHRIVEIDIEDGVIWTQGDANNTRDGVVTIDEVKGRVIGVVPQIGVVTLYVTSPYGMLGISSALVIIFIALIVNEYIKQKDKKKAISTSNNDTNIDLMKNSKIDYTLDGKNISKDNKENIIKLGMSNKDDKGKDIFKNEE